MRKKRLTTTMTESIKRSVINMKAKGYSVKQIALNHELSEKSVCEILGVSKADTSVAYAKVHTGLDQDLTGLFRKYSTMPWV